MPPKADVTLVGHILNCMIKYHAAGISHLLDLANELAEYEEEYPVEFAKAERVYYERYAPRKERENYQRKHSKGINQP